MVDLGFLCEFDIYCCFFDGIYFVVIVFGYWSLSLLFGRELGGGGCFYLV